MDLLQLKYFQTVANLQHMTKAAQLLQVAQPALSVSISRLEEDIGVPLFNRTGRNIVLNDYGKFFLKRVTSALNELEAGCQEITDLSDSEAGSIAVAASFISKQFCNIVATFAKLYPKAIFRITQTTDEKAKLRLLESGDVDMIVTLKLIEQPGIAYEPLAEKDIFLAVAPTHKLADRGIVTLQDLAGESFINFEAEHSIQSLCHEMCFKKGFAPKVMCTCDSSQTLMNLIAAGSGVAFYSSVGQKRPGLPFVLLKVADLSHKHFLYLAWEEQRYFSKVALSFRKFLIENNRVRTRIHSNDESKKQEMLL